MIRAHVKNVTSYIITATFFLNMTRQATGIIILKQGSSVMTKMQYYLSLKIMKQITMLTKRRLTMVGFSNLNTGLESIILLKETHGCNSIIV